MSIMAKRKWLVGAAVLALVVVAFLARGLWTSGKTDARAQGAGERVVTVETATAARKKVPVLLTALGTVTPIASVAIKPRIDTAIMAVHFRDGERVEKGQLLFTLDCRQIEAQISQTEGAVARDRAQLAGAERDVTRYTDLVSKNATPVTNLDNAKTQADVFRAAITSDQGVLDNLKVQQGFCKISAPIPGRISAAAVKVGNIVRQADLAPMATINQTAPVYVSFSTPQRNLDDIRQALAAESATVDVSIPGGAAKSAAGQVTMVENTVDPTTGMIMVRATMPNANELLWPGALVNTVVTLREQDDVVVPTAAVQVSQTGTFVFVVKDNKAVVTPVKVARTLGRETALESGLNGNEVVVTDGQLQLTNGRTVRIRPKAGA
jgi:multidrug efflux system membrane fusion protein